MASIHATMPRPAEPEVIALDRCPLCGSRDLAPRPAPHVWIGEPVFGKYRGALGVSACAGCSFEFVNPRPGLALLGAFYGGSDYTCHDPHATDTVDARALHVLDFIAGQVTGRRILDFGCGAGVFLRCALAQGWDAHGHDLGAAAIEQCRRQGLPATSSLDELPRAGFDAVVLNHVFEHVVDHAETLATLRGLLAPGGRLFMECPNVRSLRARLSLPVLSRHAGFDERYRAFPIHLSYFSPQTLRRLLEREGFEVERSVTWGFGIEELRREPERAPRAEAAPAGPAPAPPRRPGPVRGALKPVARAILRRLILDTGLGENVMVVARPAP
jgi:2-polyprenyl-3-methyl-5-hydroxy-6-metoxy-1,4-benzoquinol methylase